MNDRLDTWTPRRVRELGLHLSERDVSILHDLERFRLLTSGHLQRLHFGAAPFGIHRTLLAGVRATNRVLLRLERLGVIRRVHRRVGGPHHGSSATIWQLGPAGERFLRALRGDPDRRRFQQPGSTFALHTLAVADIAVELLEHTRLGHYDALELEFEPVCWRTFQTGAGTLTLKPDLLAVTADQETESHFFIEVDRGTEHLPAIRRKCDLYMRYYRDGAEERLRGLYPAVVWIVPDEARANSMRDAIEKDISLDTNLFIVITTGDALCTLAPYGALTTTDAPRKEDHQS